MCDVDVAEHHPPGDESRSDGSQEHIGQIHSSVFAPFVDCLCKSLELFVFAFNLEVTAPSLKQFLYLVLLEQWNIFTVSEKLVLFVGQSHSWFALELLESSSFGSAVVERRGGLSTQSRCLSLIPGDFELAGSEVAICVEPFLVPAGLCIGQSLMLVKIDCICGNLKLAHLCIPFR